MPVQTILNILCTLMTPEQQAQAIITLSGATNVVPNDIVDIICSGESVEHCAQEIANLFDLGSDVNWVHFTLTVR